MKTRLLIGSGAGIAVAALCTAYALWGSNRPGGNPAHAKAADAGAAAEEPRTLVVIPPKKFETMKITTIVVTKRKVREERTVRGLIAYKHTSRVDLKAPVDSVVEQVLVKPGDALEPEAKLAVLTSPRVGTARAEVEKRESDVRLANQVLERAQEIAGNLQDLLKFLKDNPKLQDVEKDFDDKVLGDHRKIVLPAYAKYVLADKLWASGKEGFKNGVIAERDFQTRESNRDVTRQDFLADCDQSQFNARQALLKAQQDKNFALRMVGVAQRELSTLLGAFSKTADSDDLAAENGAELTRYYLVAPFRGTVEDRQTSDSQRVDAGTLLFTFADTDTLEVEADVYVGDWQAVSSMFADKAEGQVVKVSVPFGGTDREFEARVEYVGRAVGHETGAVPIHAEFDNSKHEFKPGMLAWIKIPVGKAKEELVVPPGALLTHDRQAFVFVEDESEPRQFQRVDVKVGIATPEWVTITQGLKAGQRVVVEGSRLLKAELLLEPDED